MKNVKEKKKKRRFIPETKSTGILIFVGCFVGHIKRVSLKTLGRVVSYGPSSGNIISYTLKLGIIHGQAVLV